MNCELMLTYDTPALWQTGSRNLTGQKKRFPRYGVPIWSLWPNIRFLPSIVAEKNTTKNEHICSMCIKINKVGKQEVGIWRVQKRYPQYGIPIWCLWQNIRFLSSTVTEKNATKNILDGRTDRGKTVYPHPPSGSGGIFNLFLPWCSWEIAELVLNNNHSLLKPYRHHYLSVTDLFLPSYSWKIAHLVLNNNPAHSCCVEVDLPKLLYPNTTC